MRKKLLVFFLFGLVLILLFAGCAKTSDFQTTPSNDSAFTVQGTLGSFSTFYNQPPNTKGIDTEVAKFINSATRTVDIAIYNINRQNIIDALIARKQAGVILNIIHFIMPE